eukprot:Nitzschia sp. Nitz4//scaffold18_size181773//6804//7904//NITZ4_001889-RA/size181773-snap-gene-0.266-mRNA-1//-1//CDS//3329539933//8656//frame0
MGNEAAALVGTAVGLGVGHVLTGPDHLGSLVTLSAVSEPRTAFFLGIRWGIGHSTGLLVVGVILIARDLSQDENIEMPEGLARFFESLVGVFMLVLGVHGFHRAFRLKREMDQGSVVSEETVEENLKEDTDAVLMVDEISNPENPPAVVDNETSQQDPEEPVGNEDQEAGDDPAANEEKEPSSVAPEDTEEPVSHSHVHHQDSSEIPDTDREEGDETEVANCLCCKTSQRFATQVWALFAGIFHGLAGPGGVLGVIPAVQLHDAKLATVYLATFCISSTLTMGCFACLYGWFSLGVGKRANLEFQIHCFSSGFSIFVGVAWLILSATGTMEKVFH